MNLSKKYIQFNELVIDGFDMLTEADLSGGFKTVTQEYSFQHGSYAPFKSRQQLSKEQTVSMTLNLDTRKLSCDQKEYYKDFVTNNIIKPGRLWAIQGKQLLWAFAFVRDFGEAYATDRSSLEIDVEFVVYEGYWHKADPRKVFLRPYDICNYLECQDFHVADECNDCCTSCVIPAAPCPTCACECGNLEEEYSLCVMKNEFANQMQEQCGSNYKIIYNCEAGKKIWGKEALLGQKICKEEACKNTIAGLFYSDTILDSENVIITIIGAVNNPLIMINGNYLRVSGEYDGKITIYPNGDTYYEADSCCGETLIDMNNLLIPSESTFGFTVHHGNNSLLIETGNCCSMACAYVKVDSITL